MIYLIKTSTLIINDENNEKADEVIPVLKIGYTEDSRGDGRFKDYTSNGLSIRIIKRIPGGSWNLEHTLQRHFQEYKLPGKSIEWFYYNEEIIDFFNSCDSILDVYRLFGVSNENELVEKQFESKSDSYKLLYDLNNCYNRFIEEHPDNIKVISVLDKIVNYPLFREKMKALCICSLSKDDLSLLLTYLPEILTEFYNVIGPERIKELRYRRDYLMRELNNLKKSESGGLVDKLNQEFLVGEKYTRTYIKDKLLDLYRQEGLTKTPKAVDLLEYFELREVILYRKDGFGKRDKGCEILSIKKRKEL